MKKRYRFKFKKGDKIYHDGTFGRAVWKIHYTLQGDEDGREPRYLAQLIEKGPRGWKRSGAPFVEVARVVDPDFALLSEAPAKWVKPNDKDSMASLMRMMKPLDPLKMMKPLDPFNKFKLIK
jgi:hypothetical protein